MNIRVNWSDFKQLINDNNLGWKYLEHTSEVLLYTLEGPVTYYCILIKESQDYQEFENNYKNKANLFLRNSTLELDSVPKFLFNKTSLTLSDTDTEIVSVNTKGYIEYILLNFNRDDVEVTLLIDSEEAFRVVLSDLKNKYYTKDTSFFKLFRNGKELELKFDSPLHFKSSFQILARKTINASTKLKSYIVFYKEVD